MNEPTEKMIDAARGFLMGLELGLTKYEEMRLHLSSIGDDLDCWPDWAIEARGHIPKAAKAFLIYKMMVNAK